MILRATCEMKRNVPFDGYTAIEGKNLLILMDDRENEIDRHTADVLWCGSGSPFPTPPGGPWRADYMPSHSRFGQCFYVHSDMETEIFIHFAARKSYGCLIINPNPNGKTFMDILINRSVGLKVINNMPVDNRSDADKKSNPIDYKKIGRIK